MSSHQQVTALNGNEGFDVQTGDEADPASAPLIVVSNRLPFVLTRDKTGKLRRSHRYVLFICFIRMQLKNGRVTDTVITFSAGGLVTALGPVVIKCGGLWIGWPGSHDMRTLDEIPEPDIPNGGLKSQQVKAVLVRQELFDSFYNGCCNGTFWPLFHSMPDRAIFSSETWKVNYYKLSLYHPRISIPN